MAKFAFFLMDLRGGGAERVMLNLARGFGDRGHEVHLVLVRAEGPYLAQVPAQVKVIRLEARRLLLSVFALASYLRQERPAALISALEDTNIIALWARRLARVRTEVVVTVHNTLSREARSSTQIKRRLAPTLARWFYPWAKAVVGVSEGVAADLRQIGLKGAIAIYNPIVTPELLEQIHEPLDHPWFATGEPPVVLAVGRLEAQKDFETLVRAFAQVHQQRPCRLMILGEGDERSRLEALIAQLDLTEAVALPGFVKNPYIYMRDAGVLVLSSAWEGFGNVLVEAMVVGTPVVSTNCESGPAEILAGGEYGQLVPVGDADAMAKAIAHALATPAAAEHLKAHAMTFSLDRAVTEYQQILGKSPV